MEYYNTGLNEYAFGSPTEDEKEYLIKNGFEFWRIVKNDDGSEDELWVR